MYGEFRRRGPLGSRGVFPQSEVVDGQLLRLVDRPFTRRLTHVQVMVEYEDDAPADPQTAKRGIRVNAGAGRVRSAYLPIARLGELAAIPRVRRVAPSLRLYRRLERAIPAVGQRLLEELREGARGGEVVIGIVDSGIDASLSEFRGRIERYWDQTNHGSGVAGAGYGVEHLHPTAMRSSPDVSGHGTHLASIAAGSGSAPGSTPGVNPRARLVIVKTGFTEAEVLDGVRYVRDVARDLELPAVVNLSLGGHAGPHDGSGFLGRALDALSGPGFIVCAAAGNEGALPIHARLKLEPGQERSIQVLLQAGPMGYEPEAHLYGWARLGEGESPHLEVDVEGPGTAGSAPTTGFHEPLRQRTTIDSHALAGSFVRIALPPVADGDQSFIIEIVPGAESIHPGPWTLRVRNEAKTPSELDLWSGEHPFGPAAWLAGEGVNPTRTIGEPGDTRRAITVGAWTTRLDWPSEAGAQTRAGTQGEVSEFSSRGPLRTGRGRHAAKPDLVAPGEWLVAARSRGARIPGSLAVDAHLTAQRGTSLAAAFVSGWISLLLARDQDLGPRAVRRRLRRSTTRPQGADGRRWGAGRLGPTVSRVTRPRT